MTTLADDLLVVVSARHSDNEIVQGALEHLRIIVKIAVDDTESLQDALTKERSATSYEPSNLTEDTYEKTNRLFNAFKTDALVVFDRELGECIEAADLRQELQQSADRIVAVAAEIAQLSRMPAEW